MESVEEVIDFTDAPEELSPLGSDSENGSSCSHESRSSFEENDYNLDSLNYDFWAQEPTSIDERRDDFLRRTGLELERWRSTRQEEDRGCIIVHHQENVSAGKEEEEEEREDLGLRCVEVNEKEESVDGESVDDRSGSSNRELVKVDCVVGTGIGSDAEVLNKSCRIAAASSQTFQVEEINKILGIANWVHKHFKRRSIECLRKKDRKESWIKRLSFRTASSSCKEAKNEGSDDGSPAVQVNLRKKQWKELSSLYQGQVIDGHKGNIMAMKFSPDGKHLVSGGQDGAVRIWEVVQDERSSELDVLGFEHSSLYISADGVTNADTLNKKEDGNGGVIRKLKKLPERACIVAPKKFFKIAEKPLHDFHEHEGAVLDISWSERGYILSASVDKTVRLWQMGQDHCLRVFSHNDYVTCVQFNPVDDNCFISGSIDGKVRLWSILCWQVIHYADIKEIVTAICYQPDGKGAIAGSILGNCHFYELKDNRFHLDAVVSLKGKSSSSSKIVNSFQFSPKDPTKLIVTSGDYQVRILSGVGIFCKLKGRNGRMHLSASFTVDGKYVVSASADSNVYIWNCSGTSGMNFCYRKSEIKSCESFFSENAVIAVPWHGFRASSHQLKHWSSVILPSLSEVDFNVFKDVCQKMAHSDMWGLVIVTGGSDGRIRVYHNYGLPVKV